MRPRTNVLASLASIAPDCYQIVNINTKIDAIDVVGIERKRDRTRDRTGTNAQLASVRGDQHA
jgi:hypothetical protein